MSDLDREILKTFEETGEPLMKCCGCYFQREHLQAHLQRHSVSQKIEILRKFRERRAAPRSASARTYPQPLEPTTESPRVRETGRSKAGSVAASAHGRTHKSEYTLAETHGWEHSSALSTCLSILRTTLSHPSHSLRVSHSSLLRLVRLWMLVGNSHPSYRELFPEDVKDHHQSSPRRIGARSLWMATSIAVSNTVNRPSPHTHSARREVRQDGF